MAESPAPTSSHPESEARGDEAGPGEASDLKFSSAEICWAAMFTGFNGEFRRRPDVSIRGASKKESKETLVKRAQEERQKREVRKGPYKEGIETGSHVCSDAGSPPGDPELHPHPERGQAIPGSPQMAQGPQGRFRHLEGQPGLESGSLGRESSTDLSGRR